MDVNDSDLMLLHSPTEAIENISMPLGVVEFLNDTSVGDVSTFTDLNWSKTFDVSNTSDWTENLLKEVSFSETVKSRSFSSALSEKIHHFKRLCTEVNRSRLKCNKSKLIVNVMDHIFNESSLLPRDLKVKCADELRYCELKRTLASSQKILTAINVDTVTETFQLSKLETNLVQVAVREAVTVKCSELKSDNEVISEFLNYRPNSVSLPRSILTEEEGLVLNRIAELATTIESCGQETESIARFIEEVYATRVQKYRKLHKLEVDSLESKTKLIALQIKNLNYMIENSIMQQHEKVTEAIDILHKDLRMSLDEAEYALQKARTLKESYKSLRGTRFEEILLEFKELRESLKHKSWALKQIKSTHS